MPHSLIKSIIYDLLIDLMGGSGIVLMLSVPTLEYVNVVLKIAAGIGGLILLIYSIQLKRILIKKEKKNANTRPNSK